MNAQELRDAICGAVDFRKVEFPAPEWGVTGLFVREWSAEQKAQWIETFDRHRHPDGTVDVGAIHAIIAILSLCDAEGAPVFTVQDIEALNKKSAFVLERIYEASDRLNFFSSKRGSDAERD